MERQHEWTLSYLVEVFSRNSDLQVMDSIKLHLHAKGGVQQTVRSAGYYLGASLVNGNRNAHPPSIQLRHDREARNRSH